MAQSRVSSVALASATSANGTARNGAALNGDLPHPGTLVIDCGATIVTGSVVAAFKMQGSIDGTTWVDLKNLENVATVTLAATGTVALLVPMAAYTFQQFRAVATCRSVHRRGRPDGGDLPLRPRGRLLV